MKKSVQTAVQTKECLHCGLAIPKILLENKNDIQFCCSGCEYVYALIHDLGLKKFYSLKEKSNSPKTEDNLRSSDFAELEAYYLNHRDRMLFNLEGLECAACVWLIKKVALQFQLKVSVNTVLSTLHILNNDTDIERVRQFLNTIQSLGYSVSFGDIKERKKNQRLLIKMGVCVLIAINVMGLNIAIYLGLGKEDETVYQFVQVLIIVLASFSVFTGGMFFIKKSFYALQNKLFHFDIPISLGIILSYLGSMTAYFLGFGEKTYFDSLSVFIALMLSGRFLQERWLERNRASILNPVNFKELKIIKISKLQQLQQVEFNTIRQGDHLLLRSGDFVPTECFSTESNVVGEFDYQWISGESDVIKINKHEPILAGARYIGQNPLKVQCNENFDQSRLSVMNQGSGLNKHKFAEQAVDFSKYYTLFVLSLLCFAFIFNSYFVDLERAFLSVITISVVTCPCAIGVTLPIMQFILQQKLFQKGVFLQNNDTLSMISKITAVVFDKTGTLTFLNKKVKPSFSYESMSYEHKNLLFSAVARSKHPLSQKIFEWMLPNEPVLQNIHLLEKPGYGLYFQYNGVDFYLGKANDRLNNKVVFMEKNQVLCDFDFEEVLLYDSINVIDGLKKSKKVFLLSGDKQGKVNLIANQLGLDLNHIQYECMPEDKKNWVTQRLKHEKVLFLGDGLNDVEAMQAAFLAGASLSQSMVASNKSDFCFKPFSLHWLDDFFQIGQDWKKILKFNYFLAIAYNVLVATLAMIGWIGPLEAAIIMPTFSIVVLFLSSKQIQKKPDTDHFL